MTNRLIALATALAFFALGAVSASAITADACPQGWVSVQGPALCELEGMN